MHRSVYEHHWAEFLFNEPKDWATIADKASAYLKGQIDHDAEIHKISMDFHFKSAAHRLGCFGQFMRQRTILAHKATWDALSVINLHPTSKAIITKITGKPFSNDVYAEFSKGLFKVEGLPLTLNPGETLRVGIDPAHGGKQVTQVWWEESGDIDLHVSSIKSIDEFQEMYPSQDDGAWTMIERFLNFAYWLVLAFVLIVSLAVLSNWMDL